MSFRGWKGQKINNIRCTRLWIAVESWWPGWWEGRLMRHVGNAKAPTKRYDHAFEPGVNSDGDPPNPGWCNICGVQHIDGRDGDAEA